MKRTIFVFLVLMFSFTISAQAALVDNGDGTITDTDTNLMWLQDGHYTMTSGYSPNANMTWADSMVWADTLDFAGYDDWRLPSSLNSDGSGPCNHYSCIDSEIGHIYFIELDNINIHESSVPNLQTGPFINVSGETYGCLDSGCFDRVYYDVFASYWTSTEYAADTNNAWLFAYGYQTPHGTKDVREARSWAVRDIPAPPPAVPEPISSILFLIGGATLGFRRSRKA